MNSIMSQEQFKTQTGWKMTYAEYKLCYCPDCPKKNDCVHSGAYRRVPKCDGGLGLCPNLNKIKNQGSVESV